jgi:hypothetical protein
MKATSTLLCALLATMFMAGCGKNEEKKEEEQAKQAVEEAKSPVDALQALADKAEAMGDRETVDPVDFRKLKELLPETLAGLPRTEATGEKSGAMGFTVSAAEGRYKNEKGESLKIGIVDTGGLAGVSTMTLAAWSIAEIDKETTEGYEKTTKVEGYKAFEKYNNKTKAGELNVLVEERYIVDIEGDKLSMEQLKEVLKSLDLTKLASLK